jgi:hypothetical protein
MRSVTCLFTLIFALSAHAANQPANSARAGQVAPQGSPHDAVLETNLWIAHLDQYQAQHSELTEEQQSVILQGRDLLAAGLLHRLRSADARDAADARDLFEAFKARASNAFSRAAYAEAFVRLGRPSSSRQSNAPGGAVSMIPDCDCNPSLGDCGGECVTGSCRVMPDGCGTFGTSICYGLCW